MCDDHFFILLIGYLLIIAEMLSLLLFKASCSVVCFISGNDNLSLRNDNWISSRISLLSFYQLAVGWNTFFTV